LALVAAGAILSASDGQPSYSAESVANSAANAPGLLAPNTLATIYGANLTWGEARALQGSDIHAGELPIMFPGMGVQVIVGGIAAHLLYVSEKQINFLVPSILEPGKIELVVLRDGWRGPIVQLTIEAAGPGLFLSGGWAIAARLDKTVATADDPLRPGDTAVLFATGLGLTVPRADYGRLATRVAPLLDDDAFEITLDGTQIDKRNIGYAGLAPTFAGLYQINVKIPDWAADNPEIRLSASGIQSPPGIKIPIRRAR
jgi:uncharacterized protein (TIGR03437 family)